MIEIKFAKDYSEITAKGHSGYAEPGHDIVCASVSSAFVFSTELLKNLEIKHAFGMDENIPFIGIKLAGRKVIGLKVMASLINTMKLLNEEYPDYVSIECVDTNAKLNLKIVNNNGEIKVVSE